MDLSCIKARVENHFYRRIHAIKHDLKYLYTNAASFNRPKSDIVKNAKVIADLAWEIIGDTTKTKEDVSSTYHRIVENFKWNSESDSGSESSDNDNNKDNEASDDSKSDESENSENEDGEPKTPTKSRRLSRKKSVSPNLNPKKWKHDCNELLNEMVAMPMSAPFREPVSEIEYPDYHRFVATPMDLSTVRESLHIGDYNSPEDFKKDIRLIFKNSEEFNTNPKSKVLGMTQKLEDWFNQRITTLVHDWKMTLRRLTNAKIKHKAKKQDQSPDLHRGGSTKGKGKGKGKGQSNRINKKRTDSTDEEDDQDDADYSTSTRTAQAGPSTLVTRSSPKKKVPSTAAPPLRNAMTEANAGRRTSSRQTRAPLRFQDHDGSDEEQSDEEEAETETSPAQQKRLSRPRVSASAQQDNPSTSSAPRTGGIKVLLPQTSDAKEESDEEDDEEEIPLAQSKRANIKRKISPAKVEEDQEEEPLVKRATKKVIENSDSEEDIPLAARRKPGSTPGGTVVVVQGSAEGAQVRHSSRASRPTARYEETESEAENNGAQNSRGRSSRKSNKRSRRASSSEPQASSRRSRGSQRKSKPSSSSKSSSRRRMAKRPRRSASTGSRSQSSKSSSSSGSSSGSGSSGSSKSENEAVQSSSRSAGGGSGGRRPQRQARPRKIEQDSDDEHEIMPQRKRQRPDSSRKSASGTSSKRRNVKRPIYFEGDDNDDGPAEPEMARPARRGASKRPRDHESMNHDRESEDSDDVSNDDGSEENWDSDDPTTSREKAYLRKKKKKTTVTSRGRVSKPNPRIV